MQHPELTNEGLNWILPLEIEMKRTFERRCKVRTSVERDWWLDSVFVPLAALTNYPRLEGLEQHKYVIFPFWKVLQKSVVSFCFGLKSRVG